MAILFNVATVAPSFSETKTYKYLLAPLPDWGNYADGIIDIATSFWVKKHPEIKFQEATSFSNIDFQIVWIKDFGGEHVGIAYGAWLAEVALGNSFCNNKWNPHHPDYITNTAIHEIGHIIGYKHSDDPNDIMYPIVQNPKFLEESYQFNSAPGYFHFVAPCSFDEAVSYDFTVSIDDPNGLDVYYVPSITEYEKLFVSEKFNYYPQQGCFATAVVNFKGSCKGVSGEGGLLIKIPEQTSQGLVSVEVTFEDKTEKGLTPQKTGSVSTGFSLSPTETQKGLSPFETQKGTASVNIDKKNISQGHPILISGTVTDVPRGGKVHLDIVDPFGQTVSKLALRVTEKGYFETPATVADFFEDGSYTISVFDSQGKFMGDSEFLVEEQEISYEKEYVGIIKPEEPTTPKDVSQFEQEGKPIPVEFVEEISRDTPWYLGTTNYEWYYNDVHRTAIEYPSNWGFAEIDEHYETYGDYEESYSFVKFENYEDDKWEAGVWVGIYENEADFEPGWFTGQRALDDLASELRQECFDASFEVDGFICTEQSLVDTQIIEVNGLTGYQVRMVWTEVYPDGEIYRQIRVETDIPVDDDYWIIDGYAVSDKYPDYAETIDHMTRSFMIDVSKQALPQLGTAEKPIEKPVPQKGISTLAPSQPELKIPSWIKNTAKWWSEGSIGDTDFTEGIEYMIKEEIMRIPNLPEQAAEKAETKVPDWIKNNAKWWSEGKISDNDFVRGIQYLVEHGIIRV